MPQQTSDSVLRAGADSARIAAAAVDAARDQRPRRAPFNSQPALVGIVPGLPVPDPEAPSDAILVTLEAALNLPILRYDVSSRQNQHLSRPLTERCIAELERQVAAATTQLAEAPDALEQASSAYDQALADHQQATADLVAAYKADWRTGDVQWGQGTTTSMLALAPDAPMRDGKPLSDSIVWRRQQRFQERLAAAQRTVTRLSAREPDLRHALGVWAVRLGELRLNLQWHRAQDRELGLEDDG